MIHNFYIRDHPRTLHLIFQFLLTQWSSQFVCEVWAWILQDSWIFLDIAGFLAPGYCRIPGSSSQSNLLCPLLEESPECCTTHNTLLYCFTLLNTHNTLFYRFTLLNTHNTLLYSLHYSILTILCYNASHYLILKIILLFHTTQYKTLCYTASHYSSQNTFVYSYPLLNT